MDDEERKGSGEKRNFSVYLRKFVLILFSYLVIFLFINGVGVV